MINPVRSVVHDDPADILVDAARILYGAGHDGLSNAVE